MPVDPRKPLTIRLRPDERARIERAAEFAGKRLTEFIRETADEAAKRILADMAKREKGKGK